jgi:hypothetical protein
MTDRLNVHVADGKYTVIQTEEGDLKFLRQGVAWPHANKHWAHVGLILALAQDLRDARSELAAAYQNKG